MSRSRSNARKRAQERRPETEAERKERLTNLRREAVEKRKDPEKWIELLRSLALSDRQVWDVARELRMFNLDQKAEKDHREDEEAELALIAQLVAPKLAAGAAKT